MGVFGREGCAVGSLCSLTCPVGIDTGALTKKLRAHQISPFGHSVASFIANHYEGILTTGRVALRAVKGVNALIPDSAMTNMSLGLRSITANKLPLWSASLPSGRAFKPVTRWTNSQDKVVYFSSCINRTMANPKEKSDERTLDAVIIGILEKAGYDVIIPQKIDNLCCGMPFSSKGYIAEGKQKSDELKEALKRASENGKYPILCDMSPCSKTIAANFGDELKVHDTVEFILDYLVGRVTLKQIDEPIVIHTTCSTRKTGLAEKFEKIARMCSSKVTIPSDITCCGFAGDRGFTFPELNKSALRHLKSSIPSDTKLAFSTSKICEIGLSEESGLDYRSIFYLVERCIV